MEEKATKRRRRNKEMENGGRYWGAGKMKDAVEKTPERRDVLTKGEKSRWESWRCESLCARNRIYHH